MLQPLYRRMMIVIAVWLYVALWTRCIDATADEKRLYQDLFASLNPVLRPVANASDPVVVTMGAALQMIIEMDERNQHITTSLWMRFQWEDSHLRWDPDDYGGTRRLIVPLDRIWRPDIVLYNNADAEFHGMIDSSPIITHSGIVYWNTPAIFKSSCNIDVSYFPFDEQRCILKFGSWSYDALGIDLRNKTTGGDTSSYVDNGEWDIISVPVQRHLVYYNCCLEPFPDITFTIVIRRRPFFYVFNLLLPCILTSFVAAVNFLLPADSGEKIGLVLTVLLALTVFLLLVAETIPPSEVTPIIGKYFAATIFIVSLSIIVTVFVLHLHYQLPGVKPVPLWLRKLAFVYLAPIFRMNVSYSDGKQVVPPECNGRPLGALKIESRKKAKHFLNVEDDPAISELARSVASIRESLDFMTTRLIDQDGDEDILTQWKFVAQVFDRLFFCVYILLTVMTTVIIFCQFKHHSSSDEVKT